MEFRPRSPSLAPRACLDDSPRFIHVLAMSLTSIAQSALALPIPDRAALIDRLFDSIDSELDQAGQTAREQRWAAESERRLDAVERGELATVDGPTALLDLRRRLPP